MVCIYYPLTDVFPKYSARAPAVLASVCGSPQRKDFQVPLWFHSLESLVSLLNIVAQRSLHHIEVTSFTMTWPDIERLSEDYVETSDSKLEWGACLVFSLEWGCYCPWLIWTRGSPPPFFLLCYLNLLMFDWRIIALQYCVGITVFTKHQHESAIGLLMSPPTGTEGLF